MIKDGVKIELTTHKGSLYVCPNLRLSPEDTNPPKHIGFVYHVDPQKPSTMFVGPVQRTDKDHWKLEGGYLVRVHRKWRKAMFEPRGQREMPITFEKLTGRRITRIEYEDGYIEILEDNWLTAANPTRSAPRGLLWRGETRIKHQPLEDEPIMTRRPTQATTPPKETTP